MEAESKDITGSEAGGIRKQAPRKYISRLDIHIDTGRFHQIRAQLAHAGWPILGDSKYGTPQSLEVSRQQGIRNVALFAYKLEFVHPKTGKKCEYNIS